MGEDLINRSTKSPRDRWLFAVLLLITVSLLAPMQAYAQTLFPVEQEWSNENGWLVYKNTGLEGCFAENKQADGTVFLIGVRGDTNNLIVGFSNDRLEFGREGELYKLKLLFDGKRSADTQLGLLVLSSKKLLFGNYPDSRDLRNQIARSNVLRFSRGKERLANVSLKGTSATLKALDDCHAADIEQIAKRAPADTTKALESDDLLEANRLNTEASKLRKAGKYLEAESLFRRSLAIIEKAFGTENPIVAASLNNLAILLSDKGDYDGAELLYRRSLAIREKALGSDHRDVGESVNNLAVLLRNRGDYEGAELLHRRALAIKEKALGPDHPEVANSLNNLANLLRDKGDLAAVEPLYRRALAIWEKAHGTDNQFVGGALNNLATLLRDKGDYDSAEQLYRRALAVQEKVLGTEHRDVGQTINNLAIILSGKGDYEAAEPLHRRALAIREKVLGPDHRDVGQSLVNLAILLRDKGDYEGAEPLFRRSLAIWEKALGPNHRDVGASLNNLAILLRDKGDYEGAEQLFRRSLAIWEKALGPDHQDVGTSLNNLAAIITGKGDYEGAEPLFRRSLSIREKALGPDHRDVASSLNNLALLLLNMGNYDEALDLARQAAGSGHPNREVYLDAIYRARLSEAEKRSESFQANQQTTNTSAGAALRNLAARFASGSDNLARLVRQEQDEAAALEKLKSSILSEISKPREERNADREKALRNRANDLKLSLGKLRDQLTREFPDYAQLSQPQILPVDEVQALLDQDEALIVVDVASKREVEDYVWIVTSDAVDWRRLMTPNGEIAGAIANLRRGLNLDLFDARKPIDAAKAHELYRQVLGPIDAQIQDKKHLIFVLNGAVSSLPPQLLVSAPPVDLDHRKAAWLVKDHAITVLPTVSSLKLLRSATPSKKAPKPFRGYADPVFDAARESPGRKIAARSLPSFFDARDTDIEALREYLPRLPATAIEVQRVARSLAAPNDEVIVRQQATEAAVKQAPLDQYNIVYFATHGLVAGDVEQLTKSGAEPALAFTVPEKATALDDGLLTASEVAKLKLNSNWVVLSACNTAAGSEPGADALSGLARAFFYAGTRSLLVSHWVVDDIATAELMSRTFAFASKNPSDRPAEALRQAMLSVMNEPNHPEWADPVYWAPFILVGQPRPADREVFSTTYENEAKSKKESVSDPEKPNTNLYAQAQDAASQGDYQTAIVKMRPVAEGGNINAIFRLAEYLIIIAKGPDQLVEAFELFKKAAVAGMDRAMFQVGELYENGIGTEQNFENAIIWYVKAIKKGNRDAYFKLGYMYIDGKLPINYERASILIFHGTWWNEINAQKLIDDIHKFDEGFIKRFQFVLKNNDYYSGNIDGVISNEFVDAIKKRATP